jgi:hypothetical protein
MTDKYHRKTQPVHEVQRPDFKDLMNEAFTFAIPFKQDVRRKKDVPSQGNSDSRWTKLWNSKQVEEGD